MQSVIPADRIFCKAALSGVVDACALVDSLVDSLVDALVDSSAVVSVASVTVVASGTAANCSGAQFTLPVLVADRATGWLQASAPSGYSDTNPGWSQYRLAGCGQVGGL